MFNETPDSIQTILANQPNFRDLGGIPTIDGRNVKPGLLYRSGEFSKLSDEDIINLEQMGIRMIIDFRSDQEVINYPTPEISTVRENKRITAVDSARLEAEKLMEEQDEDGLSTILIRDYKRLVNDHQDDFREFFRVLATTDLLPLVYHCAAGKDRTGLATYLLLIALGVSEEEARKDYMMSNIYFKSIADKIVHEVNAAGNNGDIIWPILIVREEYLDAALGEMNEKYGGIRNYIDQLLEVDTKAIKRKYLI